MLLRKLAKRKQKETETMTTHKIFVKTHIIQQTKQELRQNINKNVKV